MRPPTAIASLLGPTLLVVISLLVTPGLTATVTPQGDPVPANCQECNPNGDTANGTSTHNIPGSSCYLKIKKELENFDNSDCTSSQSNCYERQCSFTLTVSAKKSATGCNGIVFAISGSNTSPPVTSVTTSYQTMYTYDGSSGRTCGDADNETQAYIRVEYPDPEDPQNTLSEEFYLGGHIGCTACTSP